MPEPDDLDITLVGPASGGGVPLTGPAGGPLGREPLGHELGAEWLGAERPPRAGPLTVAAEDLEEGRYHRLDLIPWWDRERLAKARVLVVGAGALGNEIIKNFALLGLGHLFIIDLDTIELSNLTRSVLFREEDTGKMKAEVAARRASLINPTIHTYSIVGDVIYDLGLGFFREMDLVVGGLDNREARLAINQNCWRANVPWIDGAIEVLHGVARVFVPPDGACYECTMNADDYKLLSMRRSCALLSREEMVEGKVPTTPTTASVIAGIQVQEAVKLLHHRPDLPVLAGRGFFFNGLSYDTYVIEYTRREDCLSHETYDHVDRYDGRADETTLGTMLKVVRDRLGSEAVLDFAREIVSALLCQRCRTREPVFNVLGRIGENQAKCPKCGQVREPEMTHSISGDEPFLDRTLAEVGIPPYDVVTGRVGLEMVHWLLAGDRDEVMRGLPPRT